MSAQTYNITLNYDPEKRLKEIIDGLKEDFLPEIIEKEVWSKSIITTNNGLGSEGVLTGIENSIKELAENIGTIKTDGSETRFLIFEDKCRKLLTKLDAIQVDKEFERKRRKEDVEKIKMYSTKLKESSVKNLEELLTSVERLDHLKTYAKDFLKIKEFIKNSDKSTITEVDNQRDHLEDIKRNLQSNYK